MRSAMLRVCAALVALLAAGAGAAGEVRIQVVDAAGRAPLEGAAVCLGTPANPAQFGALRSGADGQVDFGEVPATPLLLTVSRDQYRGHRRRHSAKRFDVVIEVALHTGGLGPQCDAPAPSAPALADARLQVVDFALNAGRSSTRRRSVTIQARVAGNPTHYRVSERPDFDDTDWVDYRLPGQFRLSPRRGRKTVYFQVRRLRDSEGASLQSLSPVASARIDLN